MQEEVLRSFEFRKDIENESGTMTTKAFGAFLKRNSFTAIPPTFCTVALVLELDKKEFHDWYKNHLSDFTSDYVQQVLT